MTIRSQIARGYGLVLGLALAGTTTGLLVGSHLQKQALVAQEVAIAERKLLSDLQVKVLYNRPTKQLSPYLSDESGFRFAVESMMARTVEIQNLLENRQRIYDQKDRLLSYNLTSEEQALRQLLDDYEVSLSQFQRRLLLFSEDVGPLSHPEGDITAAQQLLIAFVQSSEFANFIVLPTDLVPFVEGVEAQERTASEALAAAISLQTRILFGSLMLSVAIAALIAYYTSRAIAKPIQGMTTLAHRITQEGDFSLQVPALGKGEVVSLATSFNQLIAKVNQLLTQLNQKSIDLEAALNQLKQQQMQLVQAEKMSSLGQLVAGVAHEINNPVSFIHGNITHAQRHIQALLDVLALYQTHYPTPALEIADEIEAVDLAFVQDDLPKMLTSMRVGTQRIRQIVMSLRTFSRMDESTFKSVDIHEGLESAVLILQHRLNATAHTPAIAIKRDYDELPPVQCAPGELNQVFMNLLLNAVDALQFVSTQPPEGSGRSQSPQITLRTTQLEADWVQIEIADNGPGMSQAVQAQVFDPFFTTKAIGAGTGMGMPLCYQIITETHHGKLEVFSTETEGTAVIIQIPYRPSAATQTTV